MNSSRNKTITLLLSTGILACVALLPWSRWLHAEPDVEAKLTARVAEYARLRKLNDWMALYAITDPADRRAVPLPQFLSLYGLGTLKTIEIAEQSRQVDRPNSKASVVLSLDAELQLDKLPPNVRRSLGPQDPSQLRKTSSFVTEWRWSDDEWWIRMDVEATTGRTADGKEIKAAGG